MVLRNLIIFIDWLFFIFFNRWGEYLLFLIGSHIKLIFLFLVLLIVFLLLLCPLRVPKEKLRVSIILFVLAFSLCVILPFQAAYNTSMLIEKGIHLSNILKKYHIDRNTLPIDMNDLSPEYLSSDSLRVFRNSIMYRRLSDSVFVLEIHSWYLYSEFYRFDPFNEKFVKTDD